MKREKNTKHDDDIENMKLICVSKMFNISVSTINASKQDKDFEVVLKFKLIIYLIETTKYELAS